ncbi:hypothetical protein KQ313_11540 [Synechococcus sp. CS-1325]|uniref:hypothetical protein n=1 Tax=unclassified Synechococcus TaxID=2626047 RepID=UPI000DB666E5|nr:MULTISPECIES: hypothetical protein [unclassified Synechococcus]MCT0200311.1 hypothetical protein [Synechococcus sp. CS-1325]MCT0214322.1 hypothetical protein [Synechococcus sp. CS-1326]MCT0234486.1 hypothetical protein [Synechococcus sp. CS-1327]PZU98995.1 MAG: hypothetical protein DCF24_10145 [Cyanobium sp.]
MNGLSVALAAGLGLALAQQQLLLQRPPRLLELRQAAASSGPAALRLRFSRPLEPQSVASRTTLKPALPFDMQGNGNPLLLLPKAGERILAPLRLHLGGEDGRGLALAGVERHWDPRPHLLAVVPVAGGEQLQVRQHDGRWTALTPVWPSIPGLQPLGDGSGVGLVSRDQQGSHLVWRLDLHTRNLSPTAAGLGLVERRKLERLGDQPLLFAHLSSNRAGDLLVQASPRSDGQASTVLWKRDGGRQSLELEASGPIALLPQGGELIVPESEGLSLRALPPQPARRQVLPGSRDLSSFCPVAGRALLVRHWPDFRRSLELVEPGQAPRTLWLGSAGLAASACSRGGERVWALLIEGLRQPRLVLLGLDQRGRVLQRRELTGLELEPGTDLHYDPTTDRLLLAVRSRPEAQGAGSASEPQRQQARAALIDASSLEIDLLEQPVRQVSWLVAG